KKQNFNNKNCRQLNVVGYFGSLNPVWLDWSCLISVARELRSVQFEVVGDNLPYGLWLPDNIRVLSHRKNRDIKKIISNWTAAMLPLRKSLLSMSVDLIVSFEYLAMGIGVIATDGVSMIDKKNVLNYDGSAAGLRDAITMVINGDLNFEK